MLRPQFVDQEYYKS